MGDMLFFYCCLLMLQLVAQTHFATKLTGKRDPEELEGHLRTQGRLGRRRGLGFTTSYRYAPPLPTARLWHRGASDVRGLHPAHACHRGITPSSLAVPDGPGLPRWKPWPVSTPGGSGERS